MTNRNAVFTGSNGDAWPALDNGDTWSTSFWASPTIDPAQLQTAVSATVNGSNVGTISAAHNLQPRLIAATQALSTTAASTSFKYTGSCQPSTSGVSLIFVITSAAYSHQHVINGADCTGGFLNQTFAKVTETEFSVAGPVYWHLTIFRTVVPSADNGTVVVTVQTAAGGTPASQATGGTIYYACATSTDTSSNGANAIRANSVAASATTGQPAVTLPSNVLRYSSLPIALMVHNQANTTSDSANATTILTSSFATPNTGAALMTRTLPAVGSIKTTAATMTGAYASATSAWGALGIEVLDSSTSDTYTDRTRDYVYARITSNTANTSYEPAYVYAEHPTALGPYGPWESLIGRYVESGGTKYWLYSVLTLNDTKDYGQGYCGVAVDNGTTTTYSVISGSLTSTTAFDISGYTKHAMRVRVLSNGDLWVSAKWWDVSEPAWPTAASGASSASAGAIISNCTYTTNDALRNGSVFARTGLSYTFPATDLGDVFSSTLSGPTDGTNTASWSTWKTTQIIDGSATITGTSDGASAATALITSVATVTLTGSSDITAAGYGVSDATATLSGLSDGEDAATAVAVAHETVVLANTDSELSASASVTAHAEAVISASSDLAADGAAIASASSSLDGAGNATADGLAVSIATTTLAASGAIDAAGGLTALATATVAGTSTLSTSGIVLQEGTELLAGTSSLTASATIITIATATCTGSGTLSAEPSAEGTAALDGAGALVATGQRVLLATATLAGLSDGTGDATHLNVASAVLSGTAAISVDGQHVVAATSQLTAIGNVSTTTIHENNVAVVLAALGQLSSTTGVQIFATTQLAAVGSIVAAGGLQYSVTAALVGVGSLAGAGKWVHYITNVLRTTSTRKVGAGTHVSAGQYDGEGSYAARKVGSGIMTTVAREQT